MAIRRNAAERDLAGERLCAAVPLSRPDGQAQPPEHEMDHGEVDHRLADPRPLLVVLRESPIPPEPSKCPLDHPSARQHREADRIRRPLDDLDRPTPRQFNQLRDLPAIAAIRPDQPQARESPRQLCQDRIRPIPILHARRMHLHREQQSERIHDNVPLAPVHVLCAS